MKNMLLAGLFMFAIAASSMIHACPDYHNFVQFGVFHESDGFWVAHIKNFSNTDLQVNVWRYKTSLQRWIIDSGTVVPAGGIIVGEGSGLWWPNNGQDSVYSAGFRYSATTVGCNE
jgi:hypothetical protein